MNKLHTVVINMQINIEYYLLCCLSYIMESSVIAHGLHLWARTGNYINSPMNYIITHTLRTKIETLSNKKLNKEHQEYTRKTLLLTWHGNTGYFV